MVRQGMKAGLWVCLAACGLLHGCYGLEDDTIAKLGSFTVTPVTGLVTTEAGGSATFTVVLGRQPSSDVVIPLSSSNVQEATLSTPALTFTNANWNVPQTVTVTGADDFVDDGSIAYSILLSPAISADYHFSGLDPADVAATNTDNDTAGVTVTPTIGLFTTENGGTASFTVVLDSQPTADVSISITSSNILEGTVSTASLLFTSLNWNAAQTVIVTGVPDGPGILDGNIVYAILTGDAVSADPNYSGFVVDDVSVTNNDTDQPGVTVTPTTGLVTTEAGAGTDTFSVVLNTQPGAGNVVVFDVASSNTAEGLVSAGGAPAASVQLTFTDTDWNVPQVVTVTGVNDPFPIDDGDVAYTLTVTTNAGSTTEAVYDPIDPADVAALNDDDDDAGIIVTPLTLSTIEGGPAVTFTVALASVPTTTITLSVASLDTAEGTVSPATLTFLANATALNPLLHVVTVTPVDDAVPEPARSYTVQLSGDPNPLADPNYLNRDPDDVVVTHNDNDIPGITVVPDPTTLTTSESLTTASFTVVLDSQPTSNVSITLTGLDVSEGSLSTTSLLFTTGNWNLAQNVTVTGVEDILTDNAILYTLTGTATSSDSDYNTLPPFTVDVTNNDNDGQPPGSSPGPGSVALPPSIPVAFDDKRVMEPCVIQSAGPNFVLWYEGSNAAGQKHEQVGRATATLPTTWTRAPATPVLTHSGVNGTIDKNGVGDPCVLFIGAGDYRMWFGGRENAANKTKIGRATSADGITWVKDALSPGGPSTTILAGTAGTFDATGVASPHVILDGTTYKMWYQGLDGAGVLRIGYATSTNGTTWTKNGPAVLDVGAAGAFDDGGVSTPCVIKDGSVYRMWYIGRDDPNPAGLQRMGYAQSTNGITWVKYASNPILGLGAPGAFDDTRLWSPWVVKDGALFRIWYAAENAAGDIRLAYTTSN